MLDIKTFLSGIDRAQKEIDKLREPTRNAVRTGLTNAVRGTYAEAMKLLNGPGRTPVRTKGRREWSATGYRTVNPTRARGQRSFLRPPDQSSGPQRPGGAAPGAYPVPRITGHLSHSLNFLEPGQSKSAGGTKRYNVAGTTIKKKDPPMSVHAGEDEVVLYDSAAYANAIHDKRPFIEDGFHRYGGVERVAQDIEDELRPLFGRF